MTTYKLGRNPREFRPTIHLSSLLATQPLPTPAASVDHVTSMPQYPNRFGVMQNDVVGDCTVAAAFHAHSVWNWNSSKKAVIDPDVDVLSVYEAACGYNPKDPSTDQGGSEQAVLEYWRTTGIPTGMTGKPINKILGFVEVNPRNAQMVKIAIEQFGLLYIGFNVPANIMPKNAAPPAMWDVASGHQEILGGHAVILPSYNAKTLGIISWGQYYRMTWKFFSMYTEESYALISPDWITATGKTPCGYTLDQLTQLMKQL